MLKRWSEEEIFLLIELYPIKTTSELVTSHFIGRTEQSLTKKAKSLKINLTKKVKNESVRWSDTEVLLLLEYYHLIPNNELLKYLPNRNVESIASKAKSLKLTKNYSNSWNPEDIEYLKDNYLTQTVTELAKHFNKTIDSVKNMSRKCDLTKTVRLDLSYQNCLDTAKKYKTKSEFRNNHPQMVETATHNGWYTEICEHMISCSHSRPQLICREIFDKLLNSKSFYNTRRIIKPYELDIYYPVYRFAIEYNGSKWHESDEVIERDRIKNELCTSSNIFLYTICQNLESKNYISDIKADIIRDLPELNKRLNLNISIRDVENVEVNISDKILDILDITAICDSYNNYTLWKKENESLYYKLIRSGNLERFTGHMNRSRKKNIQ